MTTEVTTPRVNVLDPEFYVDPWDAYRWLREEAPVFWDPVQKLWAISRYDDIIAIEVDGARYSSFAGSRPHLDQREDRSIINMDDPEHQQQRNLVARRFTPGAVRNHEEHVRGICREILDDVAPRGECEAIEAIASRVPAIMIGDLLGYPREMWERVRHWSEQIMLLAGQTSPDGPPHESHPGLGPVIQEFFEVTTPIVKERQADPRDDLISIWATTEGWDTGHVLDETILVLNGGAETTRTVIGTMIRELALQPDQRQLLLDRPELVSTTAVEEFIRWVTPVLNMCRVANRDYEISGQTIRQGQQVVLMYPSANRDPAHFDEPERYDVTRDPNHHIAFGFGTHFCLGAALARLEIKLFFEEFVRRVREIRVVPGSVDYLPNAFVNGVNRAEVELVLG